MSWPWQTYWPSGRARLGSPGRFDADHGQEIAAFASVENRLKTFLDMARRVMRYRYAEPIAKT